MESRLVCAAGARLKQEIDRLAVLLVQQEAIPWAHLDERRAYIEHQARARTVSELPDPAVNATHGRAKPRHNAMSYELHGDLLALRCPFKILEGGVRCLRTILHNNPQKIADKTEGFLLVFS